jgi:hypothetical protein
MKTLTKSILAATTLTFSSLLNAIPIYSGATTADFGVMPGPAWSNAAGYYIWSNDSLDNWSVRWTGNDFGAVFHGTWGGQVALTDLASGSVVDVRFEANQIDATYVFQDLGGYRDFINFDGNAGPGYDGFNFSLNSQDFALMNFSFWSTAFTNMVASENPVEATGIYIGQDFASPQVEVIQRHDKVIQYFQVRVPEPGTIMLFGLGLMGIGATWRMRKTG